MVNPNALKFELVRNCEPGFYTPVWEAIPFIREMYPNEVENGIFEVGKRTIIDLVKKGFVELHIFRHADNQSETFIAEDQLDEFLNRKEYWIVDLAPEEKTLGLHLTALGFDVAVGKLSFEQAPW